METQNTIAALAEFGERVRDQMVNNLMENKSFVTGDLARSIVSEVFENQMMAVVAVNEWYGITVEDGIGRKAGGIPPIAPIKNWIRRRNIVPKSGTTVEQFAFAIANKIAKRGTNPKARPFAAPAIQEVKNNFGDFAIEEATGKDIKESVTTAFKQSAVV